jgi:protein subunit release factor B
VACARTQAAKGEAPDAIKSRSLVVAAHDQCGFMRNESAVEKPPKFSPLHAAKEKKSNPEAFLILN